MHKVFISYHHENDQAYKNHLVEIGRRHSIFMDSSVNTGDIPDHLSDEQIRQKIRDDYLRDSTVTIVLVGKETKRRKHVDWEIHSSMYDGTANKKSGILVINLPGTSWSFNAPREDEKQIVYPETRSWTSVRTRQEYQGRYPYMPERIIDNLLLPGAQISIAPWKKSIDGGNLRFLIDAAFRDRDNCKYDLRRPMRRANS